MVCALSCLWDETTKTEHLLINMIKIFNICRRKSCALDHCFVGDLLDMTLWNVSIYLEFEAHENMPGYLQIHEQVGYENQGDNLNQRLLWGRSRGS
jgi:hypothetical protein